MLCHPHVDIQGDVDVFVGELMFTESVVELHNFTVVAS